MSERFDHLSVKGFRRLADLELDIRPLTVVIGANGIGKTSLLDVLSLLARSAQGAMSETLSDYSGLTAILTYDHAEELSIGVSTSVQESRAMQYVLRLRPQGAAYTIENETLTQHHSAGLAFFHIDSHRDSVMYYDKLPNETFRPNWDHNPLETSLSQVPKMFQEPEEFRRRLASSTFYHVLNVDPRSPVRLPQPMRPEGLPGKDGEALVSCLYNLRETDRDRFDAIQDTLRSAFPGFDRLDFPPVAAGTLAMIWRDTRFSKPLYTHQLSEGMLRFLWLSTLLQSKELTALTLLDEPEVSLHPELLSLLADLLRGASQRSQVVVATHSDRLIRFLKPSEVVVMDSAEDGTATAKWADQLDLDAWLADYCLDELWSNGRLGARS